MLIHPKIQTVQQVGIFGRFVCLFVCLFEPVVGSRDAYTSKKTNGTTSRNIWEVTDFILLLLLPDHYPHISPLPGQPQSFCLFPFCSFSFCLFSFCLFSFCLFSFCLFSFCLFVFHPGQPQQTVSQSLNKNN